MSKRIFCFCTLLAAGWLLLAPMRAEAASGFKLNDWKPIGRIQIQTNQDSVELQGGWIFEKKIWGDAEISVRLRAPADSDTVQLWGGFRCRDRDSRYVFALRGGDNNDIYLARYAPDGGARFLGFAPLDFKPAPGTWYRLRILIAGNRFQIYLNDETLPRLNAVDPDASWTEGSVLLGGGWARGEYSDLQVKELSAEAKTAFAAVGNQTWKTPEPDKEAERRVQRAAYRPVVVEKLNPWRTEISLDGNWLFLPDYEAGAEKPITGDFNDENWHVMEVPRFWTPGLSWLHGEIGFPELKGVAQTKGVADSLYVQETRRVEGYTFDWKRTKAAWYRHYVDLPKDLNGRRFELVFDAIAKISEVWVNGIKVGTQTGMFGQLKCDITDAAKAGRNVIAVHVISEANTKLENANKVEGVAVTVEVTSKMLHSLPHGMFQDDVGGIWQPVRLVATAKTLVSDSFVQPRLNGVDVDLDILNSSEQSENVALDYSIVSAADGKLLYAGQGPQAIELAPNQTNHLRFSTPELHPKLWSPENPNLYLLEVQLKKNGAVVDKYHVRFGFRTFSVADGKFLLNGKPFWLRGGNPFPNTLRPNDGALARRFMEIAREGNVNTTRSHIVPFTTTWLDAADEKGMAVSYEGSWPWLMLTGDPPSAELLSIWKEEFLSLIRQHRNHPSLVLWTVNNEMKFPVLDANNLERMKKKWIILNDMIQAMRATDPTRPVVADSAYVRKEAARGYRAVVRPNGFDDGDVDDVHRYYGWYNESFFHFYDGEFGQQFHTPGRPLISQEMSTGYPRSDDGHATRFYLFKHYTPQALVGDDAYENADPSIFLTRQTFMTKELAETLRRTSRDSCDGILFFSYFTWLKNAWDAKAVQAWPEYHGLQKALQPVLVSAELYGRHFYAGNTLRRRVCIINDSENGESLPVSQLQWAFRAGNKTLSSGQIKVPPMAFYTNRWLDVDFKTPANLPSGRVNSRLVLTLKSEGKTISENGYDVVLADPKWAVGKMSENKVMLNGSADDFKRMLPEVAVVTAPSLETLPAGQLVVISAAEKFISEPAQAKQLKTFVEKGGRVLLLNAGSALASVFPEKIRGYVSKEGEIVTMHIPESPVFSGIEPLDLAWFEPEGRYLPLACTGVYRVKTGSEGLMCLADQCDIHAYLQRTSEITRYSGTPLVEIRAGKGVLISSEMNFAASENDPIARRLLANVIGYLNLKESQNN
jgi:hypothetical protein